MSGNKDKISKENKAKESSKSMKFEDKSSLKNLKKIRKDLMSFAQDEILNIKKSKKDISVAHFEPKEYIAPSKYSVTTKKLQPQSQKKYNSNFESVDETNKVKKNDKEEKVENNKNVNNEVSSSDISDDDDE